MATLGMSDTVSWGEGVEGMKCLKRGKAPGLDGILNVMVIYGGERLVEVILQVMSFVMKSEFSLADWRSLLVSFHKDVDNEKVGNYREIAFMAKVFMCVLVRRWKVC